MRKIQTFKPCFFKIVRIGYKKESFGTGLLI